MHQIEKKINVLTKALEAIKLFKQGINDELNKKINNNMFNKDNNQNKVLELYAQMQNRYLKNLNLYCIKSDPEITFLGTGSMYPSTFRNVTGNLIRFTEYNNFSMLIDCGEGTYSQMVNSFGMELTDNLLIELKLIFITHIHGDHLFGITKLLDERERCIEQQGTTKERAEIFLVIPALLAGVINNILSVIRTTKNIRYIFSD